MADVQIEDGIIRVVQLDIQDPKAASRWIAIKMKNQAPITC